MLKGISPRISPDLLKALCEMGHGDEVLLADAHFPGHALGARVLRADGLTVASLLEAILPLLELDWPGNDAAGNNGAGNPLSMMQPGHASELDPEVEADYMRVVRLHVAGAQIPQRLARTEFYQRARTCFLIAMTGEVRAYGNIILRKGVTS